MVFKRLLTTDCFKVFQGRTADLGPKMFANQPKLSPNLQPVFFCRDVILRCHLLSLQLAGIQHIYK